MARGLFLGDFNRIESQQASLSATKLASSIEHVRMPCRGDEEPSRHYTEVFGSASHAAAGLFFGRSAVPLSDRGTFV